MYYYGGYQGYGNACCNQGYGGYQGGYGYGTGYGAAVILVLFILHVNWALYSKKSYSISFWKSTDTVYNFFFLL